MVDVKGLSLLRSEVLALKQRRNSWLVLVASDRIIPSKYRKADAGFRATSPVQQKEATFGAFCAKLGKRFISEMSEVSAMPSQNMLQIEDVLYC